MLPGLDVSKVIPCAMRSSFNLRFSSANVSRSRVVLANISLSRNTSCSRALMYISFRSRCVLIVHQSCVREISSCWNHLCACLFSSCRRVKAGLLSGLGPLLLGGCPSGCIISPALIPGHRSSRTSRCLLLPRQILKETEIGKWTFGAG